MKTGGLFLMLIFAFVVQSFHFIEHIAQIIQIYALGIRPPMAHGLLGAAFDFEWVHFIYNIGLEVILIELWLSFRHRSVRQETFRVAASGTLPILTGAVLLQGYHSIEHIVKLYQYLFIPLYQSGAPPTPGILPQITGWPIFLVHFVYNLVVWGLLAIVVWRLRANYASPAPALGRVD